MASDGVRSDDFGSEREQFLATEEASSAKSLSPETHYTPVELRKRFLISYCVLILIIFILLQLTAAAYSGAPDVGYLVPRSTQQECAPGVPCLPVPDSYTKPTPQAKPNETKFPKTSLPSSYTKPTSHAGPNITGLPEAPSPGSYTNPTMQWTPGYYFVGGYLPTLMAILLSICWKCVYSRLKEMEPIYQLNQKGGTVASTKDIILLSYTNAALPKVFLSSLSNQHWLTWLGSVNMILVYLCTAFASETVYISTTGTACHVIIDPETSTNNGCQMYLALRRPLVWTLVVVLCAIFVFIIFLIFTLRRQVSGIFSEASSIVGIASLYPTLLAKDLINCDGTPYNSVVKSNGNTEAVDSTTIAADVSSAQDTPSKSQKRKQGPTSAHPISLILFWFYLVAVLVMILYYCFVSKPGTNNSFEDFMDSQSFGIGFFMTCIGLAIKLYWGTLDKHLRSMAPYVAMASVDGATADRSVLIRTASHPIVSLAYSSSWRQPLLALVTISAVLSEVLVITLNAIPFSTSTAYLAFRISVYISTGILAVMIATIPLLCLWQIRTKQKAVGNAPRCIAEVLAMLHCGLLSDFGELRKLDATQRDEVVRGWNYVYSLKGQNPLGKDQKKIVAYSPD